MPSLEVQWMSGHLTLVTEAQQSMSWMYNTAFIFSISFYYLSALLCIHYSFFLSWPWTPIQGPMDIQRVPKIPGCVPPIWGVFSVHLYCTSGWKALPFSFFHKDASYTRHSVALGKAARNHISHTWLHQQTGCMAQALIPKLYPPKRAALWRVSPPTTNLCLTSPLGLQRIPFLHLITPVSLCLCKLGTVLSISGHIQWPVIDSFFLAISKKNVFK